MSQSPACPELTHYKRLLSGELSDGEKEAALGHLEGCAACAQKLGDLPEPDTLVHLLRQADTLGEAASGTAVARLVERLSKLRPQDNLHEVEPRAPGRGDATGAYDAPVANDEDSYDFLAPAQAADELGRLGPYRVLAVLGVGGMGVVFRAEDPQLTRTVALKAMLPNLASKQTARLRFLREARAAAAIKHDHIVAVYHVGEERGVPYLAMEFLEGETLDARLQREGRLPVAESLRIGREMALGLAAAHKRDLIHRDIKPANIWLEAESQRVKILDFGLARSSGTDGQLTQQGAIVGTPAYMAPEQGKGNDVDHRCDLFSLGCVLYRMATGAPAFRGNDVVSTLMAVATETPAAPHTLNAALPAALSQLIVNLLAKDAADRPVSAQAVAETLERIGREPAPQTMIADSRLRPIPARRPRWRVAAFAALALALSAPLGYWLNGVILRIRTPDGVIVIEVNEPNPEVYADGELVSVTWDQGGKKAEIRIKRGTRKLQVKKDGFTVEGGEVMLQDGDRQILTARFERITPTPATTSPALLPLRYKNSLGMDFALVPKGKSWLGGGGGKVGTNEVNMPQDFYMGVYLVTQEEWQKFMGRNPSHFTRARVGKEVGDDELKRFPVEDVSWTQAQAFIELLNEKVKNDAKEAGWEYRLPTELQWEYACRGGPMTDKTESVFDFYFETPTNTLSKDQANFNATGLKRTTKVGSYPPNRLGLYDMQGNVWEWCADQIDDPKQGPTRVDRGGSFADTAHGCRPTERRPLYSPTAGRNNIGFRLARFRVSGDRDRRAAEWVLSVGGTVGVNEQVRDIKAAAELPPDPFRLTSIALEANQQVATTDLAHLDGLVHLKVLRLDKTPVSKAGLAHLKELTGLRTLHLGVVGLSDAGLAHLAGLKNLEELGLWGNPEVTDDGLAHLKGLPKLTSLDLNGAGITNVGLMHLKGLANLKRLVIMCTQVTDAGLVHLQGLTNLQDLGLSSLKVSDPGLAHLKAFKNLTSLGLDSTPVGDAGLGHLKDCKNLRLLNLRHTKVTAAAIADLQNALPNCKVAWDKAAAALPPRYKNNIGMEFVLVQKGKFRMGGGGGNPGTNEVEIPHDFYIGTYEVTQEEWHKVTTVNPSRWSRAGAGKADVENIADEVLKRFPVESVTWTDTQLFLEALNARDKQAEWVYRLPKEAEWEYACRGGPSSNKFDYAFDFYFETPSNDLLAGQANCVTGEGPQRTCAVGSYKPNRLGLYDMHGNVWEWCDDVEKGADGTLLRMARGGGFGDGAAWCRAAFRHPLYPPSRRPGAHFGLRVARVPVGKASNRDAPEPVPTPRVIPSPSAALEALRREQIPLEALKMAGDGDPDKAPASLVAVLGEAAPIQTGAVRSVAFSPDGRWLATASDDMTILLRELAADRVSRVLHGHTGPVSSVAFSKDSLTLISASRDGTLKLWSTEKKAEPQTLQPMIGEIAAMAASADGRFLAAAGAKGTMKLWKWRQWQAPVDLSRTAGAVTALAFSPDGKILASAWEDGAPQAAIRVYQTTDAKLLQTLLGNGKRTNALAFSRGGGSLAAAGGPPQVKVWNLAAGKLVAEIAIHPGLGGAPAVAFGANETTLVFSMQGGDQLLLYDLITRNQRPLLGELRLGGALGVAFSPDGKLLAVVFGNGGLYIADAKSWEQKHLERGHRHFVHAAAFSPDGRAVLSGGDDFSLRQWNLRRPGENQLLGQLKGTLGLLAYGPDGKTFVAAAAPPYCYWANVLDAATGKEWIAIPPLGLSRLTQSPDGKTLAAGYGNMFGPGDIRLWDLALGKQVHRFPVKGTWHALQFRADGKHLAGADLHANFVRVWDVSSGAEIRTWKESFNPKKDFMPAAAFSPDLGLLAVGHDNGTIVLWDANGQKQRTLAGHSARVHTLKFTSDGKTLVSSGHDGTIRIWNPALDRARAVIPLGPANQPIAFDLDPSGKYLVAVGHSPVIYVLRLPTS